jgi:hypothetical protein
MTCGVRQIASALLSVSTALELSALYTSTFITDLLSGFRELKA